MLLSSFDFAGHFKTCSSFNLWE